MRRVVRVAIALLTLCAGLLVSMASASAQDDSPELVGVVDILQVSGLIDPIQVSSIERHLVSAVQDDALALVIQLNSTGVVVSDERYAELLDKIEASPVAVGVWVGESGASVTGLSVLLTQVADISGIAPGAKIGNIESEFLGAGLDGPVADLFDRRLEDDEAVAAGIVHVVAPTIGDFVLAFEDRGLTPVISQVVNADTDTPQRELLVQARFNKLSLLDQLMHTVASPAVAYLLVLIGLTMIMLDFYTAGIGVAGVVGAVSLLLAAYGLGTVNTRPLGLILIVVSVFAFGIDVQAGIPRFWSGVGVLTLIVGSFTLYDGHSMSWITLLVGIVLTIIFMISGMPSLVRTRFSTTTIGREWMIGEMGEVVTDISPDGTVRVRDALWRARANRLTPLSVGDRARVVAIEGTVLEVEPEEGGARDYREMRG